MQTSSFERSKQINALIQHKLSILKIDFVDPVIATQWLISEGLQLEIGSRPGSFLRSLCRKGLIVGAEKKGSKWLIMKVSKM